MTHKSLREGMDLNDASENVAFLFHEIRTIGTAVVTIGDEVQTLKALIVEIFKVLDKQSDQASLDSLLNPILARLENTGLALQTLAAKLDAEDVTNLDTNYEEIVDSKLK